MGKPHILAIPYPAQGHVIPLMELSLRLVNNDFKVTFVNTGYSHRRILSALLAEKGHLDDDRISLVSIPDGLEPWEDRKDHGKVIESIYRVIPGKLEELIDRINANASDREKITCVIVDISVRCALDVADKMKIKRAAFWPAAAAALDTVFSIPKLIDEGIIDNDGNVLKNQIVELGLSSAMSTMDSGKFFWTCSGDSTMQKIIFDSMFKCANSAKMADRIICNSAYDLEPGAFDFAPENTPIGPLLASNPLRGTLGYFWPANSSCLKWLDNQLPRSVLYVAFGSLSVFDESQFQELATGLELSGVPFLWVVRPDTINETNVFPEGFQERIADRGKMVQWAPQQKVLSHPSIACFLSHCGWNSTMEGVGNGVPFLCWPLAFDQFLNESYICDIWKVGLNFNRNENGIITRDEIKSRVEQVFGDEKLKLRASELKKIAMKNVGENGSSSKNFRNFIDWLNSEANGSQLA